MSESQKGTDASQTAQRVSEANDDTATKATTAGALTGAAAGAVGLGAVTGGLGAPVGAAAGALLGHFVGGATSSEVASEAGKVEVLVAPGDDVADIDTAEESIPELPKVQETRE